MLKEKKYPLITITTGRSNSFPRIYLGSSELLGGGDRYPYPLSILANKGYMIFLANCRSYNYHSYELQTEPHLDTVNGYCKNVLDGIKFVISLGNVEESKIGIMGWGLGGYLASRLVTWPFNNFKLGVISNGISDFISMFESSNCFEFQALMRGGFWESETMFDNYTKASPIRYISNTRAAVLIQHGSKNPSMPVSQGRELYYALRLAGNTVKLTEYPNAAHIFKDLQYNIHSTKEIIEWLEAYLPNDDIHPDNNSFKIGGYYEQ